MELKGALLAQEEVQVVLHFMEQVELGLIIMQDVQEKLLEVEEQVQHKLLINHKMVVQVQAVL
jgi:hypothetical protein